MRNLIVYCHPYNKSFNCAVLASVQRGIEAAGGTWELIDLEADGFDPVLHASELALYNEGGHTDPLVGRYQKMLEACERLVLVTPIWWNDVPALLKGWIDKVMLVGFSWDATGHGLEGTLGRFVRRADVYTTSAEPTEHLERAVTATLMDGTLAQLGVTEYAWHNFGLMDQSTPATRAAWLAEVEAGQAAAQDC